MKIKNFVYSRSLGIAFFSGLERHLPIKVVPFLHDYRLRIINGQIERQSPQLFLHTLQDDQTDSEHA